jgi:hypothetical protein
MEAEPAENGQGTDSLTVAVRNEASMLGECYRAATVRESVLVPIFSPTPSRSWFGTTRCGNAIQLG